ncbi:inositol monophosphatase family protein [Corynebacterium alimapuense]|nr:inositol monophosphatase family protein [Corynebacterium alimapuense]
MNIDYEPAILRDIAVETAVAAAERISQKREELTAKASIRDFATSKSSAEDVVTIVDTLAEDFISDRLATLRPEDGMIGEEGSQRPSHSGVSWVVDPIDGTVNFLYGIPEYAVSIGAAVDGEVVAGAVVNVATGVIYSAGSGLGATRQCDGQITELRCSEATDPSLSLVATGFAYSAARRQAQAQLLTRVLPHVRDIRRIGAAALDLCRVAEGSVDAYYEHGINCWDYAAGLVIAQEAGAVALTPRLSTPGTAGELSFVAAATVVEPLKKLLSDAGALSPLGR